MILTSGYPPYFSLPDKVKREEAFYFGFPNKRTNDEKERIISSLLASRTLDRLANNNAFALMNT
jgi:hypothetical protein